MPIMPGQSGRRVDRIAPAMRARPPIGCPCTLAATDKRGRDDRRPHCPVVKIAAVMLHRAVGQHRSGDHPGRTVEAPRGA